ncbi:hypothetical protein OsccyDRAFT_0621 [Leptolyngbyaceae cyanobacterium JSC-12]|nr:hypothetical protein OsccyDRAFT_0621 [Leptolyngbyaceae cyanobacterium JSC-12]
METLKDLFRFAENNQHLVSPTEASLVNLPKLLSLINEELTTDELNRRALGLNKEINELIICPDSLEPNLEDPLISDLVDAVGGLKTPPEFEIVIYTLFGSDGVELTDLCGVHPCLLKNKPLIVRDANSKVGSLTSGLVSNEDLIQVWLSYATSVNSR